MDTGRWTLTVELWRIVSGVPWLALAVGLGVWFLLCGTWRDRGDTHPETAEDDAK